MEIDYHSDYVRGLEELDWLRKHTILLPLTAVKINNLRKNYKEREASELEYEQRFKFFMKRCEKEWHYRDPRGEQSLSQFAHDELGRYIFGEKEKEAGRSR